MVCFIITYTYILYVPAVEYDGALVWAVVLVDLAVELQKRRGTLRHSVVLPRRELVVSDVVHATIAETRLQWRDGECVVLTEREGCPIITTTAVCMHERTSNVHFLLPNRASNFTVLVV